MVRHSRACWPATFATKPTPKIDSKAARKLTYGLFLLSSKDEKDNGCIINSCIQAASDPLRLIICCQMGNLTRETIEKTGVFNVSVLTEDVDFDTVRRFGMQSGRDVDKFEGFTAVERSANGLYYLTEQANAMFSCKVTEKIDLGSHMMFVGEVTEAKVLGGDKSCTYDHYQSNIKKRF
ncbi:MAG: flavin reductase [Oscillospiraceae bacterium]|nr:flavin reductase [Oscillospiraceae bacterium]